ncbi:MAG: 4-hydroxybenzoate octaprenyltransferase [Candidatus Kapaibacterium sp.]|jgi:4-hydroxybenzoate polyprenyltransferase
MKKFFSFVKIEHTVFSLPVIFSGMALALHGDVLAGRPLPQTSELIRIGVFILLAATGARTVGFALNRIIDRHIDAKNPRTAMRDLPSGRMSMGEARGVLIAGLVLYLVSAWQLNPLCLALSPIPLLVFAIYPFMKRFTSLAHFGVGLSLALGPLGAYLAVRPDMSGAMPAIFLSLFTWMWVSGFDIIYSTADEEFDRKEGLHSMSSRYGSVRALRLSALIHVAAFLLLTIVYISAFRGSVLTLMLLLLAGLLLYLEQKKATDVEMAFFKINAVLGFVVFLFVIIGVSFA